jgi:hypothetical protein
MANILLLQRINAQNDFLNNFTISTNNGQVYLNWVIASGNTCDGVRVFRSSDSVFFEQIGRIDGVCGSPFSSVSYDYIDTIPLPNQMNYYRLELGNLGFSMILGVLIIDFSKNKYQIFPQPAQDYCIIHFQNPLQQVHFLEIFDRSGNLQKKMRTYDSSFFIQTNTLPQSVFLFRISNSSGQRLVSGKLMVIR